MAITQPAIIGVAVLASLVAILYPPLSLRLEVLGITRTSFENIHGVDLRIIPDTQHCEDLHLHGPSGLIFGASQATDKVRWRWFPPTSDFDISESLDQGSIIVVDPKTRSSTRLALTDISGPFITHGIDIWYPASDTDSLYIYAVNHLPNPAYIASGGKIGPQARSQIELFHHTIGSDNVKHIRSIWHPLIRTPNDIYVDGIDSFYLTNDHHYREGHLRTLEDGGFDLTPWSDIIHIKLADLNAKDASNGVTATIAKDKIQNPNGLGHGKNESEIVICRAASGVMHLARSEADHNLTIVETFQAPNTLDNPSYFHDPYAKETGRDASGYVLAGLAKAIAFPGREDPIAVWLVQRSKAVTHSGGWVRKKLFQDDGKIVSTGSTGFLIAIDPKENGGKKQAWLYVTGPMTAGIGVTRIDL